MCACVYVYTHTTYVCRPGKVPVGVSKSYSGPAAQSRLAWRAFVVENDDSPCAPVGTRLDA